MCAGHHKNPSSPFLAPIGASPFGTPPANSAELARSFDLAECRCSPPAAPGLATSNRCSRHTLSTAASSSPSRRASMEPMLSHVVSPPMMVLGIESSFCSSRNSFIFSPPAPGGSATATASAEPRLSFLFSAFHPAELRRSARRRREQQQQQQQQQAAAAAAERMPTVATGGQESLRLAALHSHSGGGGCGDAEATATAGSPRSRPPSQVGDAAATTARSPSPASAKCLYHQQQQRRESKKDSISSADQRAHPEAEEDARSGGSGGGDAAQPPAGITSVSALPSHLCCALPAKPRLCPTASSASFNATEFMPASLCSAVHRASLSHTPSRQNSSVTLAGTRTPPTMSGDECGATTSSTVELNKAPTLMSKIIKQPLGLTRKVQRSSGTFVATDSSGGAQMARQLTDGTGGATTTRGSASSLLNLVSAHHRGGEKRSFRHPSVVQSTSANSTAFALLDAQPAVTAAASSAKKRSGGSGTGAGGSVNNALERLARAGGGGSVNNALIERMARAGGGGAAGSSKKPALSKEEEERLFKMVSDQEEIQETYRYPGATINIHPLLSSLVNYTHPIKFSGFDVAEQNDLHFHMSSFSESTGLGLLKQSALEFVNYNKRQLSRIYPKGARVDSSNFLPQIFWNAGCQMVALNFQTPDVCMQLNQGKFEYNGQCGYLLKPDFMRRPDRTFDPFSESPVDGVIAAHCSVRIISGQFLCERKTGTYVEVEMYGLPTDTIRKEHRTKLVPANGLNPIYNEEPFVFRKVILPELAVLRFAVYDENGKQLGQRILPLDGLQSGYRHISLRTEHNQASTLPTLFVHLQLKTYVPDELSGLVDALADPRAYLSAQEKREEALQQMCVDELDIVDDVVPSSNQSQPQQLGVGARRDRIGGAGADGAPFESNNSIRRLQQNGSTRDHQQQQQQMNSAQTTGTTADGRAANAQSPMSGPRDASQSLRVQSDAHTTDSNKFQQVEWINVADLRREKPFLKLQKRHAKEWEEMKRRHQKMRESVQKQQQCVVERLVDQNHKMSLKKRNHLNSTSLGEKQASNDGDNKDNNCQQNQQQHNSLALRISDPAHTVTTVELTGDQKRMRSLVQSQTDEWSQLLRRLEQEEFEQHKEQIQEENALLKRLLAERQRQQIITVRAKFDAEKKELNQAQAKKSMEDSRAIQQDKSVKTKAERDRRIKELNEKNVKLFTEERRRLATKCGRHEEQLIKRHSEQSHQLEIEAAKLWAYPSSGPPCGSAPTESAMVEPRHRSPASLIAETPQPVGDFAQADSNRMQAPNGVFNDCACGLKPLPDHKIIVLPKEIRDQTRGARNGAGEQSHGDEANEFII
ncbi:hypothetical protein niasHT_032490 [Heterodera trifolii]|uniref:Phosphoinositide phospholipase C n=1 Tax=Heterodera trifolii TaxID=157864 RepID=A0ABD2IIF6_9BILA